MTTCMFPGTARTWPLIFFGKGAWPGSVKVHLAELCTLTSAKVNEVDGGDNVFFRCVSACVSVCVCAAAGQSDQFKMGVKC